MADARDIKKNIDDLSNMKSVVNAYEEIASMKMRDIRGNVLQNRDFIAELANIYRQITVSYKTQILTLLQQKKAKKNARLSLKIQNNKTACVYFSANSGLFGHILRKTYHEFIAYVETHNAEPVIIGAFGKRLFETQYPGKSFVYYTLAENTNYDELLKHLTETLLSYENVIVFYSQFQNMSSQKITMLDMSGEEKETQEKAAHPVYYFFEPSLEKILDFFEHEIFASILEQTFTESDLSRFASRIISLDAARENIDGMLKIADRQKRFAAHQKLNKRQLEATRGITLLKLV